MIAGRSEDASGGPGGPGGSLGRGASGGPGGSLGRGRSGGSGGPGVPPDADRWLVPLPAAARPPLRVFVSGVPQTEGTDYRVERRDGVRVLAFERPLQREGRLGFWRWTLMFFSIAGSYGRDDSVDVQYAVGGRTRVAIGLPIVAPSRSSAPGQ